MENINLDRIIKAEELDTNMILSLPEEIGLKLQRIIQGQASLNEKNSTSIEIIENSNPSMDLDESRKMIFKINDMLLPITILDFPSIIEAQKTIDNKTFYKSGDISQMMFVHDKEYNLSREEDIASFNPFKAEDETFNKIVWKKDYDHKYKLRSGLGRATRNIRAKRFKRKIRYNQEEILDVAKKLKSIIDNGAANYENQMKNKESVQEENMSLMQSTSEIKDYQMTGNIVIPMGDTKVSIKKPNEFNAPINKKQISLINPVNNNSNIISLVNSNVSIPNPIINSGGSVNATVNKTEEPLLNKEESLLLEEYNFLKNEYKKLKSELDSGKEDEEKARKKKKIKKRLKEIKKKFAGSADMK